MVFMQALRQVLPSGENATVEQHDHSRTFSHCKAPSCTLGSTACCPLLGRSISHPVLVRCMSEQAMRPLSVRCNNVAEYQHEEPERRQCAPSRVQGPKRSSFLETWSEAYRVSRSCSSARCSRSRDVPSQQSRCMSAISCRHWRR